MIKNSFENTTSILARSACFHTTQHATNKADAQIAFRQNCLCDFIIGLILFGAILEGGKIDKTTTSCCQAAC